MNDSIFTTGFKWLWNHRPDVAIIIIIIVASIWITENVHDFSHRLDMTEEVCKDLRNDMDEKFKQVDQGFEAVDKRFEKVDQRLERSNQTCSRSKCS